MAASEEIKSSRRKSLTKLQLQTETGIELLSLCQTVTEDGKLDEREILEIKKWLEKFRDSDFPSIVHLKTVINHVIADGIITPDDFLEVYKGIEAVLPPDVRSTVRTKRRELENEERDRIRKERASKRERNKQIEYADFMVAGVRYENRAQVVSEHVEEGDIVVLTRDYNNLYSRNAIIVSTEDARQFGFVPEALAVILAPLFDQGCKYEAHVKKILYGHVPIPVVVAVIYRVDADIGALVTARQISSGGDEMRQGLFPKLAIQSEKKPEPLPILKILAGAIIFLIIAFMIIYNRQFL